MTVTTRTITVDSSDYVAITQEATGSFINRSTTNVVTLQGSTKPDATASGDPIQVGKRYHYDLADGEIVYAKTLFGEAEIGVTPQ